MECGEKYVRKIAKSEIGVNFRFEILGECKEIVNSLLVSNPSGHCMFDPFPAISRKANIAPSALFPIQCAVTANGLGKNYSYG